MPPQIRFSKADLLHAAFNITRANGIEAVNARAIAKELGCSTQPVFRAFQSMEQIRYEITRMSMERYTYRILHSQAYQDKPYLGTGMAYIDFAREEPHLFMLLFMRERLNCEPDHQITDQSLDYVIDLVMKQTGLSHEKALLFHRHNWVAAHGLATMVATRFMPFTREEAEQMLVEEYLAISKLYGLPVTQD